MIPLTKAHATLLTTRAARFMNSFRTRQIHHRQRRTRTVRSVASIVVTIVVAIVVAVVVVPFFHGKRQDRVAAAAAVVLMRGAGFSMAHRVTDRPQCFLLRSNAQRRQPFHRHTGVRFGMFAGGASSDF